MISSLLFFLFSNTAEAKCEGYVRKVANAKGKVVIDTFKKTYACDPEVAKTNFFEFMKKANDLDNLQRLALTAIELDQILWEPVASIPEKFPNEALEKRELFAKNIGADCENQESLRNFLQISYVTMKGTNFDRWKESYITCTNSDMEKWLVERVEEPPKQKFGDKSDKYSTLMDVLNKKKGVGALQHFQVAAISAEKEGPYKDIIRKIADTVAPPLGEKMSPENKEAFENTLLDIAQKVDTSNATDVAYQLASAGSEKKAAQLLPRIYAAQYNNGFTYGVAALELAKCKDKKQAIIHYAELQDKKVLWSVREEATKTLRSSKPKLKKCDSEGDWSIILTSTPISDEKELKTWAEELQTEYTGKGYKTKLQKEKTITIK